MTSHCTYSENVSISSRENVGFIQKYRSFFAIDEIEKSELLQWLFWVLLIGFFLSYRDWIFGTHTSTVVRDAGRHICLPWFQNCGNYYFFKHLPYGYSQTIFYGLLLFAGVVAAIFATMKQWVIVHMILLPMFFWKVLMVTLLSGQTRCDFEYFHLPVVFCFLFCHWKLYFCRRAFIAIYFLAGTVKIHESWIVGSYFSSMSLGIPIFPDATIPYISNGVIFIEIFGPWLLLSKVRKIQISTLFFWILFHIYSVSLVGYHYPAYCLPILLCLFLPKIEIAHPKLDTKAWLGWLLLIYLYGIQSIHLFIKEDIKYTLEGHKLGVSMFDANHQCQYEKTVYFENGERKYFEFKSKRGMRRCKVFGAWFRMQNICKKPEVRRVKFRFIHSINGGPFYEQVNLEDVCKVTYRAFTHNSWILTPNTGAKIVGYPSKNHPLGYAPTENLIHSTAQIELLPSQLVFKKFESQIRFFWVFLWGATLFFVLFRGGQKAWVK